MLAFLIAAQLTMAHTPPPNLDRENAVFDDYATMCVLGHDHEGEPVPQESQDRACHAMEVLHSFFTLKGYCYDRTPNDGREWVVCG